MPQVHIALSPNLTARHLRVVLKYFEKTNRLSPQEWKVALETFDALGKGTVTIGRQRMSFQQVYDRYVDRRVADDFIAQLMALEDLEAEAEALQQKIAFEMLAMLEREGLYHEEVVSSEYLAAYCLYWWTSFVRGVRFEVMVFRDLCASGIAMLPTICANGRDGVRLMIWSCCGSWATSRTRPIFSTAPARCR